MVKIGRISKALVSALLGLGALFRVYSGDDIQQLLSLQGAVALVCLFLAYLWADTHSSTMAGCGFTGVWLSLAVSLCMLAGDILRMHGGFANADIDLNSCAYMLAVTLGRAVFIHKAVCLLWGYIGKPSLRASVLGAAGARLPETGGRFRCMCLILLFWLPWLLLNWPGTLGPDSYDQFRQFAGLETYSASISVFPEDSSTYINTMNPVLHTVLLGTVMKLFAVGDDVSYGILVFCVLQAMALAYVLAGSVTLLKRAGAGKLIRWLVLAVYCLHPLFPLYAFATAKDTVFAIGFLMVLQLLVELFLTKGQNVRNVRGMLSACARVLFFTLVRSSGWLLWLITAPFIFAVAAKREGKRLGAETVLVLTPLLLWCMITQFIYPAAGVGSGPSRENISVMLQQTGRYVTLHGDDVTAEERLAIETIMPYDDIGQRYSPEWADMVKNYVYAQASEEEWNNYYSVWLQQGLKQPACYADAALLMCYEYFDPGASFSSYGQKFYVGQGCTILDEYYMQLLNQDIEICEPIFGERVVELLRKGVNFLARVPVLGLAFNIGVCMWAVIVCAALLRKSRSGGVFVFVPALAYMVGLCFTPVNGSVRYALPVMFSLPMLAAFAFAVMRKNFANAKTETEAVAVAEMK